ncbi:MAG TPA: hypothetical protein VI583_01800, partial [Cyclobacteriaceae bacterium]|nr:hypothetical protein [Cyclobacteriaceae bacterium]
LWRPPDLQLALNWQKKQIPTRAWAQRYNPFFERAMLFLETSKTAYENEQKSKELLQKNMLKRARNVAIVLGVAAVIAIVFFIFALYQKIEADDKAQLAAERALQIGREKEFTEMQALEAGRQKVVADKQTVRAVSAQQEALVQRREAEYQRGIAERQLLYAEEQQRIAEQQREIANTARDEADDARLVAESSEREKNKLLYLSTAQNMAIKSLQVSDHSLQGLMAQQAFMFNVKYEGNPYDRYIYEGLYFALKSLTSDSLYRMSGHTGVVRDLAITSTGKKLYSAATDGKIIDWDLNYPEYSPHDIMTSTKDRGRVIKITSDDRWIIVGTDASGIYCLDTRNGSKKPVAIRGHEGSIVDIAILPGDRYFISLSSDNTLRLNDLVNSQGQLLKSLNEPYVKMAFSPDGKYLALVSENGKLILLDTKDVDKEYMIFPEGGPVNRSIAFSPKGDKLAAGNTMGIVNLIDLSGGLNNPSVTPLSGHTANRYINDVAFSADGNFLASGGFDGTILLWNMSNLDNLPVILRDNNSQVWSLSFSADSYYLYAGCEDGSIKVWPTRPEFMSDQICGKLSRNMTRAEWLRYVDIEQNIPYEQTCLTGNR